MKNKNYINRSSKVSLKFANSKKKQSINDFIDEYQKICQIFIDILWKEKDDLQKFPSKETTDKIKFKTWLSVRAIQCAGKQSTGIISGVIQKHNQRLFKLKELQRKKKKIKNLQRKISKTKLSKPILKNICPELDSRFVEIKNDSLNSFDIWVKFSSLGNKLIFYVPIKKTKHFNDMIGKGFLYKKGIKLSKNSITFNFYKEKPQLKKNDGEVLGIDVGINNCWTSSSGNSSTKDIHGHNLKFIQKKLSRRKKGSKGFKKAQEHRKNYINWSLKQINLKNIKQLNLENIKNLRKHKKCSRYIKHWTYSTIFKKLERLCEESGVQIHKVNPIYTSQRCSKCGWTRKRNRNGIKFKCEKCSFVCNSDLNASKNISLPLEPIWFKQRKNYDNKKGFYWNSFCREPIVPDCPKKNIFLKNI